MSEGEWQVASGKKRKQPAVVKVGSGSFAAVTHYKENSDDSDDSEDARLYDQSTYRGHDME